MARFVCFLALCLVPVAFGSGGHDDHDDHADHGHGEEHHFEWAGIFETPNSLYKWGAEKVDGDYADPGMKIVLLPASAATEAALHALESEGDHSFEYNCTTVTNGGTLTPAEDTCYQLQFDPMNHNSIFTVDASSTSAIAFFAEHFPTEFERDAHYLKDLAGEDIEPGAELPEEEPAPAPPAEDDSKPWGVSIGSAILVNLCTLVGVIFLVPFIGTLAKQHPKFFCVCTSGFAGGALLGAAFFLLLFEGVHLVYSEHGEAVDTAVWGCAALGGFLIGTVVDSFAALATPPTSKVAEIDTTKVADDTPKLNDVDTEAENKSRRVRVLAGVLLGDFVHNICDGVFIGSAFMGCGNSFGWKVAGATIYHEIAQEISDYFVLTHPEQGNLPPLIALALNFASGLGVILGALIILGQGEEDNIATGVLLAIGGGVYLHIGASECMYKVHAYANTVKLRLSALAMFALGAMLIGLVLLDHEHCVPEVPTADGEAASAGGHHAH